MHTHNRHIPNSVTKLISNSLLFTTYPYGMMQNDSTAHTTPIRKLNVYHFIISGC